MASAMLQQVIRPSFLPCRHTTLGSSHCSMRAMGDLTPALRELSSNISVHKGFKVQAALCIERPPAMVHEPEHTKRWRAFREAWLRRTANDLTISDEIVFMKFHFHFLGDAVKERLFASGAAAQLGGGRSSGGRGNRGTSRASASVGTPAASTLGLPRGDGPVDGLDAMLASEGLELTFPERGQRVTRRRRAEKRVEEQVDDKDVRSLRRLAESSLFLLVRYSGGRRWTFPKVDRTHGMAMRETLMRLCGRQFGEGFQPFVIGACPFSHEKKRNVKVPGIDGRKIFYYRAKVLPGMDLAPPEDSPVQDWAWLSRDELANYLSESEWHTVRDGLPIDGLG